MLGVELPGLEDGSLPGEHHLVDGAADDLSISTPRRRPSPKSIFNSSVTYPGFEDLVTEEVEVPSHDGTMVPLSIVHQKGIPLDGSNSCILEGYGAYGNSYTPHFSVRNSVANRGVVLAFAHLAGRQRKGRSLVQGRLTKPPSPTPGKTSSPARSIW